MAVTLIDSFTTCGQTVDIYFNDVTLEITYTPTYILGLCDPGDWGFFEIDNICQEGTDNLVQINSSTFPPFATVGTITSGSASCAVASCDDERIIGVLRLDESALGANDGFIQISATNELGEARTYSIDGGSTYQASNFFGGLAPGTYEVRVRYGDICVKQGPTVTINAGSCDLVINATIPTNVTVNGGSDGELEFDFDGGTGPFQYSTDNGDTFAGANPVTGLTAGNYNWVVLDDNGCSISGTIEITEPAPVVPGGGFDPDLVISELTPYQWQLNFAGGSTSMELFNEESTPGRSSVCVFHTVGCSDNITFQFKYLDTVYNTTPRVRVRNWEDDSLVTTLTTFFDETDGYYSVILPAVTYCGQNLYFEIISFDGSTEQFVHATSGPVKIANPYFGSVHIQYSDNKDYTDIKYQDTGYVNELRVVGEFFEQDNPQTDALHELSDGSHIKMKSTLKRTKKLVVYNLPDFMHEKLQGAVGHDNVIINSRYWIKDSDYEKNEMNFRAKSRGAQVVLMEKTGFYYKNRL